MSELLSKVAIFHQMFNMFALLLDDALKPAMPLTNGMISETLQPFVPPHSHSHKIFYKQTKFSTNADQSH